MKIKKNGQVVTLTESDLSRIVKKLMNEQSLSEKPGDPRTYDKMVIDCLTKNGFKDSGIGKKYHVLMSKTIDEKYKVVVSSQSKPESFSLTVELKDNPKKVVSEIIDVSKLDCNGLIAELQKIDILRNI